MDRENLVAHRGWQRRYPENTLPAVQGALDAGARYVEVDIQLTSDLEPVLFHDRTLRRICRQRGAIHHHTCEQLKPFSAYEPDRFGDRFAGTPIPHLRDLAALLQKYPDAHLFLEIKRISALQFGNPAVYDAVMPHLQAIADRCTIISFAFDFLQHAARQGYRQVGPVLNAWEEIDSPTLNALHPAVVFCDAEILPANRDLRALDFPLAVYEIDRTARAANLIQRGVRWVETFAVGEMLEDSV